MLRGRGGKSTADLIGIGKIGEHSILSVNGEETVFFIIKPLNLSVLSEENLSTRIYGLMTVLKGVTEIGMMCLNSRESFEDNKWFLKKRLEEEREQVIRQLIQRDLKDLDRLQIQMATSREFLILVRPKEKTERDKQNLLNRVEKMLAEQGFQAKIADKEDIKRILAVYFEQNVTTEKFEEFDGERWIVRR